MNKIYLNCTKYQDISGYLNIEENRKTNLNEYLYKDYVDITIRVRVIIHEIFIDIIEKGISSRDNIILIFDSNLDILNELDEYFSMWEIDVETIE